MAAAFVVAVGSGFCFWLAGVVKKMQGAGSE